MAQILELRSRIPKPQRDDGERSWDNAPDIERLTKDLMRSLGRESEKVLGKISEMSYEFISK